MTNRAFVCFFCGCLSFSLRLARKGFWWINRLDWKLWFLLWFISNCLRFILHVSAEMEQSLSLDLKSEIEIRSWSAINLWRFQHCSNRPKSSKQNAAHQNHLMRIFAITITRTYWKKLLIFGLTRTQIKEAPSRSKKRVFRMSRYCLMRCLHARSISSSIKLSMISK